MEIIAAISMIVSAILISRKNVWAWPTGIIGVVLYGIIFYQQNLIANFLLQFVFIIQMIYGWYYWITKKRPDGFAIRMDKFTRKTCVLSFVVVFLSVVGQYTIYNYFFGLSFMPLMDVGSVVLSIIATYLMAKKYIESWFVWILSDSIYITIFSIKGMIPSAILYIFLMCNIIYGYNQWKKNLIK